MSFPTLCCHWRSNSRTCFPNNSGASIPLNLMKVADSELECIVPQQETPLWNDAIILWAFKTRLVVWGSQDCLASWSHKLSRSYKASS